MLLRLITLFIVSSLLTGCVNLKPREDSTKEYVLGPIDVLALGTGPIEERGYIARPQLPVYMEGSELKIRSADGEITSLPGVRWAEPLDVGVARALSHYFQAVSGGIKSSFYPWAKPGKAATTLQVTLHQMVATDDGHIYLSASWELKRPDTSVQTGAFSKVDVEWLPGDAGSMVAGLNAGLEALATEIFISVEKR